MKEEIVDLGEPIGYGRNGQEIAQLRNELNALRDHVCNLGNPQVIIKHPLEQREQEIKRLLANAARAINDIRNIMHPEQIIHKVPLTSPERPPNSK